MKIICRKPSTSLATLVAVFLSVFVFSVQAQDRYQGASQESLIEALQQGGYVIYMRHGDTTGEPLDRSFDLTDRAGQRNLSQAGRAQSQAIGAAIQRLDLGVGHIASSPVFRARDTAELAFGSDQVEVDQWLIADDFVSGSYREYIETLRQYLSTPPDEGNTWLIGHVISISLATSSNVNRSNFPEGAAAVFLPENNTFKLVGILGSGWQEIDL